MQAIHPLPHINPILHHHIIINQPIISLPIHNKHIRPFFYQQIRQFIHIHRTWYRYCSGFLLFLYTWKLFVEIVEWQWGEYQWCVGDQAGAWLDGEVSVLLGKLLRVRFCLRQYNYPTHKCLKVLALYLVYHPYSYNNNTHQ